MQKANGEKKYIYMDNAATTRIYRQVIDAMQPYTDLRYGNPGGLYDLASEAKRAVNTSREIIADTIGCENNEIFFTSGGTESDNWAIKGVAELFMKDTNKPHIITTAIEHHAVLNSCEWLAGQGCSVTYVKTDKNGYVNTDDIRQAIRKDTCLISVMLANNEIGTIQDVESIGRLARDRGILFHTDAVQAYGHIPIDVNQMNIDLMSASAHKLNGPKGIGFLYISNKLRLPPLLHGGSQERGRRAGTENVAGVVGMATAAGIHHESNYNMEHVMLLRDEMLSGLMDLNKKANRHKITVNGGMDRRLPGNINICIEGVNAEELVLRLGMKGICLSTGAACTSMDEAASHVLMAIGLSGQQAKSSLRITLCEDNTIDEINTVISELDKLLV